MRNSKFVRWDVILLGLVVLRTKARNRFLSHVYKRVLHRADPSQPFWGQFWGQIGEINSYPHRLNKCAALVSLQNWDTDITGFTHRKSPTNQYINFTLRQEVVRKYHATPSPHTAPVAARNAPVWAHSNRICTVCPAKYRSKFPAFGAFLSKNGFSCAGVARTGFTCTGKACTNKY